MTPLPESVSANRPLFSKTHYIHLMNRLRMISVFIIILYPYYLYVDFVLFKDIENTAFHYTLIVIHGTIFLMSLLFLYIHRRTRSRPSFYDSFWPACLVNTYAAFYILMGVFTSINSQALTDNVYSYIIIVISAAAMLPLRPRNFLAILLCSHSLFLVLLSRSNSDPYELIGKEINATATAFIAFLIVVAFYNYRKKDFHNHLKLTQNEQNFRKLFAVNPYPLVLSRLHDDKIVLMNPTAEDFFRVSQEQAVPLDASVTYPNAEVKQEVIGELLRTGSIKNRICELPVAPEMSKWAMIHYELIDFKNEKHVLAGITDITELKKMEAELTRHASTDALTGVMNRGRGMTLLQQELERADRQEEKFVVCFADINDLKKVNDRYGHAEGDLLIQTACRIMRSHLGPGDFLFRYGGDEFIIVFHESLSEVSQVWKRINRELDQINETNAGPYTISVSHGLFAFHSGMNLSVEELIEQADQTMYRNKTRFKEIGADASSQ